jgi:hypothetical protein
MTEEDQGPEELLLAGYVPLAEHGFALPCYATGPLPNAWYTAVCSVNGDHAGKITGFEIFETDVVELLPAGLQRTVRRGDSWKDVFLWSGGAHAGTPGEILVALKPDIPDLVDQAPISLLDLALSAEGFDTRAIVRSAFSYVDERYGRDKASTWLRDTLIRQQIVLETRRQILAANLSKEPPTSVREIDVEESHDGNFRIVLPEAISTALARAGRLHALAENYRQLADQIGVSLDDFSFEEADVEPPAVQPQTAGDGRKPEQHFAGSVNILIIVSGPRARSIARHLSSPDWAPVWKLDHVEFPHYLVRRLGESRGGPQSVSSKQPVIDVIEEQSSIPDFRHYGVVIWLVDDKALSKGRFSKPQDVILAQFSQNWAGIFLIAPALPSLEPSRTLVGGGREPLSDIPFRCLIDTAAARSPFWSGNPRRSIDRRIADIVTGAAVLCAGNDLLLPYLNSETPRYEPVVLSFTLKTHEGRQLPLGMASEVTAAGLGGLDDDDETLFRFHFGVRSEARPSLQLGEGVGEIRRHRLNFDRFAGAVVADIENAPIPELDDRLRHSVVPASMAQTLRHADLAAAFQFGKSSAPFGVVVTAEAPTVRLLRAAAQSGWAAVRYTERESLRGLFGMQDWVLWPFLPQEIGLPTLQRRARNRGLATRGIDPRDVVRIPLDQFETWRFSAGDSPLVAEARRYRASIVENGLVAEMVVPAAALSDAMRKDDRAAMALAALVTQPRSSAHQAAKRISDIRTAWSTPRDGARRFVLEDGLLPVSLAELAVDEVPAQRLFIIDGDGSVPAFFTSRLFSVWARATLSRSTSWSSRFSITRTFETVPVPPVFMVLHQEADSPSQLRLAPNAGPIGDMVEMLDRDPRILGDRIRSLRNQEFDGSWVGHPLIAELDTALLSTIGLSGDASDLDILERLLEMNLKG